MTDTVDLYRLYETNENLETAGFRLEIGPETGMKVARAGGSNSEYHKVYSEVFKPYLSILDSVEDKKVQELTAIVYARTIIKDWWGVTDREGNELAFTEENVVKLLIDLPDLFASIVAVASNRKTFQKDLAYEEEVGKSAAG